MNPSTPLLSRVLPFLAFAVAGLSFASHLAEIPYRSGLRGWDNSFYFFWLRSALVDGDWDFANDIAAANSFDPDDIPAALALPRTDTGLIPNKYGLGWALLSLPGWLLADLLRPALNLLLSAPIPRDGWHPLYQVCLLLNHVAYAVLGWFLAARLLAAAYPLPAVRLALAAVFLGSPLLYYQTVNLGMAHNLVFTLTLAALWLARHLAGLPPAPSPSAASLPAWAALGLVSGLLLVTRFPAGLYLLLPLAVVLPRLLRDPGQRRSALLAAPAFLLPLLLQSWAWKNVYGSWLVFSYGLEDDGFRWSSPHFFDVLMSANHGAFYWHPLLLLGLAAYLAAPGRDIPRLPALAALVATVFLYGSWSTWNLAGSFGYRGLEILWILALPGLAGLAARLAASPRLRLLLAAVVLLLAAWNLNLSILFRFQVIPRKDPVTWAGVAAATATFYPGLARALTSGRSLYEWEPADRTSR